MSQKTLRKAAILMTAAAAAFLAFALNHPEASFPWENRLTYSLYGAYLGAAALLFALSRKKPGRGHPREKSSRGKEPYKAEGGKGR